MPSRVRIVLTTQSNTYYNREAIAQIRGMRMNAASTFAAPAERPRPRWKQAIADWKGLAAARKRFFPSWTLVITRERRGMRFRKVAVPPKKVSPRPTRMELDEQPRWARQAMPEVMVNQVVNQFIPEPIRVQAVPVPQAGNINLGNGNRIDWGEAVPVLGDF